MRKKKVNYRSSINKISKDFTPFHFSSLFHYIHVSRRTYMIACIIPQWTTKWLVSMLTCPLVYFMFILQLGNKSCFIVPLSHRHFCHFKDLGLIPFFSMCLSKSLGRILYMKNIFTYSDILLARNKLYIYSPWKITGTFVFNNIRHFWSELFQFKKCIRFTIDNLSVLKWELSTFYFWNEQT